MTTPNRDAPPPRTLLVAVGGGVAVIGLVVLAGGWWADVEALRGGTGQAVTRPTTAVGLALAGVALAMAARRARLGAVLAVLAAVLVAVQGVLQHTTAMGPGAWFGATANDPGAVGTFTVVPMVGLAVTAVALLVPGRGARAAAELVSLATAAVTGVLALSWLLAIVDAVTVPSATSPLTSAALLLLALGWLRRAAEGGAVLGPLALETAPARSMRRVLAWLVGIVALLLVLVRLGPADVPLADPSVRSAVTTTAVIGAMLVVMARVTRHLDRADRDVRVSEERLRALVDAITEVVWSTDARGRVTEPQTAWEAFTGQPWSAHQQLGWIDALHPDDRDAAHDAWLEAVARQDRFEVDARLWSASTGRHRAVVLRAVPVRGHGHVTGWVATAADVEELQQAYAELQRANAELEARVASRTAELEVRSRELERSNTELDQFASVASHDLQEPLRMVAAYSELVARDHGGDLDDEGRELLGFVLDGARRMQQLIDDLLEYSRLRTRSRDHVTVELADVVADAVRDLRLVIDETGADVRVGSLPAVEGDPAQLRMLVQNLLGNALKYRGEGPLSITVDAQAADGCWVVSVADDGIGVPEEQRERIFEPFRRLHARSRYPGTGIGLAICRRIADQHGGRIWVEPGPEGGSTFRVTLLRATRGSS